jgi:hypothetical protein
LPRKYLDHSWFEWGSVGYKIIIGLEIPAGFMKAANRISGQLPRKNMMKNESPGVQIPCGKRDELVGGRRGTFMKFHHVLPQRDTVLLQGAMQYCRDPADLMFKIILIYIPERIPRPHGKKEVSRHIFPRTPYKPLRLISLTINEPIR